MKYRYQLVDRIPTQMREGVVYHTEELRTRRAALRLRLWPSRQLAGTGWPRSLERRRLRDYPTVRWRL